MTSLALIPWLIVAVVTDYRSHRIPNWLTLSGLLGGLALSVVSPKDAIGLTASLFGLGLGFLVLLPGYVLGKMGAGDVKLMAVCGSFLGPHAIVNAGLATMLAGGVLAVIWLALQRLGSNDLVLADQPSAELAITAEPTRSPTASGWKQRFPFAFAIACGCLVVIFTDFGIIGIN